MEPILSKQFPNRKIDVKTVAKNNRQDVLSNVTLEIRIQPSLKQKLETLMKDIDLSKPGVTIEEVFEQILPEIKSEIQPEFEKNYPITLFFNIKLPKGSNEKFLSEVEQQIEAIMSKQFPKKRINVFTIAKNGSQEVSSYSTLKVIIQPPSGQDQIDIDLSKSEAPLEKSISIILSRIQSEIESSLEKKLPIILSLKINLAKDLNEQNLTWIREQVESFIAKQFPKENVRVNVKTDNLSLIILEVRILTKKVNKENEIAIDLSTPGIDPKKYLRKILSDKISKLKDYSEKIAPQTFSLKIIPPQGSTSRYLPVVTKIIKHSLKQQLPTSYFQVNTKTIQISKGTVSMIIVEVTIKESFKNKRTFNFDLSTLEVTTNNQINLIFPEILAKIQKYSNESENFILNFNIKPPQGASQSYLKEIKNRLKLIIPRYILDKKVSLETKDENYSDEILKNVNLQVSIEPRSATQLWRKKTDIDLAKPGSLFIDEIELVLPGMIPLVQKQLEKNKLVKLRFNIEPPSGWSEEQIKNTEGILKSILEKYFPANKINIRNKTKRYANRELIKVILESSIKPFMEENDDIDIDLSESNESLVDELHKIMPQITDTTKELLKSREIVTFSINIRPAEYSRKAHLTLVENKLTPLISNYFPDHKVTIKTIGEEDDTGYLTNINAQITIKPLSDSHRLYQNKIDVDLAEPDVNFEKKMDVILADFKHKMMNKLVDDEYVTLTLNILTPEKFTKEYFDSINNQLATMLLKHFPYEKIGIESIAEKDNEGYLSDIKINIIFQSANSNQLFEDTIDFTEHGVTFSGEMHRILSTIVPTVEENMKLNHVTNININLKPPYVSNNDFLELIKKNLPKILSRYFPKFPVSIRTEVDRDLFGFLSDIRVFLSIRPQTLKNALQNAIHFNLDLSSGRLINLNSQMSIVVSELFTKISRRLNKMEVSIVKFHIKPPMGSSRTFIKTVNDLLSHAISTLFPGKNIYLEPNSEKSGDINDVVTVFRIQPEYIF